MQYEQQPKQGKDRSNEKSYGWNKRRNRGRKRREEDEQRGIRMKRAEDQSRQFRCDVELLGRLVVTVIAASKHGRHSNRRASVVLPVSCCNVLQVALRGCCTKQDNDFVYLMGHKWR